MPCIRKPRDMSGTVYEQIMLPKVYCLSQEGDGVSLLSGHLEKEKTVQRMLWRFYWPTVFRDCKKYCRTCEECQLHGGCGASAPMILLLVIGEPLKRIVNPARRLVSTSTTLSVEQQASTANSNSTLYKSRCDNTKVR